MRYTPKEIQKRIEKLNKQYEKALYDLANEVMKEKLAPMLLKKQLGFTVMNGFPRAFDAAGNSCETPPEIVRIFEDVRDIEGYTIGYKLPDFNPFGHDFGALDIAAFNRQVGKLTEDEAIISCMMAWK